MCAFNPNRPSLSQAVDGAGAFAADRGVLPLLRPLRRLRAHGLRHHQGMVARRL